MVGMLNISILHSVSDIINILTKTVQDKVHDSTKNTLEILQRPTFVLARMYAHSQVCTFYISSIVIEDSFFFEILQL